MADLLNLNLGKAISIAGGLFVGFILATILQILCWTIHPFEPTDELTSAVLGYALLRFVLVGGLLFCCGATAGWLHNRCHRNLGE